MTDETTTATTDATETTPALSLQDLQAVVQVIDLCSTRGAFQGSELEAVGALRGRVQSFVAANAPTEETAEEGKEGSTDE